MRDGRPKEIVMRNIRKALLNKQPVAQAECKPCHTTFTQAVDDDLSVAFAQRFTQQGGTMHYCYNEADIARHIRDIQQLNGSAELCCGSENLTTFLQHIGIDAACTAHADKLYPLGAILCEALVAWNGSIVISSNQGLGKTLPTLNKTTIVIAFTSQVVPDWETACERIKVLYAQFPEQTVVTSPSSYTYRRGLQHLHLILIEDEE